MYTFLEDHPYYVVMIINILIWIGIFGYVFTLNKKVNNLIKSKE